MRVTSCLFYIFVIVIKEVYINPYPANVEKMVSS